MGFKYGFNTGNSNHGVDELNAAYDRYLALGGSEELPLSEFKSLCLYFLELIHFYTFERIRGREVDYADRIERCMSALFAVHSECAYKGDDERMVRSEAVGDYRVEYEIGADGIEDRSYVKQLADVIRVHFLHTGLMYRGVK